MQQLVISPGNPNMSICGAIPAGLPVFAETGTDGQFSYVTPIDMSTPCEYIQNPQALNASAGAPGSQAQSGPSSGGGRGDAALIGASSVSPFFPMLAERHTPKIACFSTSSASAEQSLIMAHGAQAVWWAV